MNRVPSLLSLMLLLALALAPLGTGSAADSVTYLVVFTGTQAADGTFSMDLSHESALALTESAGGSVAADLTAQIGVAIVHASDPLFADLLNASDFVEVAAEDYGWQAVPTLEELEAEGLRLMSHDEAAALAGDAGAVSDPLEPLQWSMQMIRAPEARGVQAGLRAVDVGILDTGIDGLHADFVGDGGSTNVDCARGRDFIPLGPGVGSPDPCVDNNFHGTHVAGIIAAQANGLGVVGVAPGVTLVPVKVCDASGFCYASSAVAGITYAGDARFDVINMSFFVDDDEFLGSTEFKCMDDPVQKAFRRSVERAISYARQRGVTPVAALGNSNTDLADPPEGNQCEVVPAETTGVVGTMALGPDSERASYSNFGSGATDVGAPGGSGTTGDCNATVLSTFPGNTYGCIQGTSMASPHAAGVAALIVSQEGVLGDEGDVGLSPTKVESRLQSTAIDIGQSGYDACFGHGRVDALRAVQGETSTLTESVPPC